MSTIVLACKTRTPDEILAAIDAGATDLGQNYVQEAERHDRGPGAPGRCGQTGT